MVGKNKVKTGKDKVRKVQEEEKGNGRASHKSNDHVTILLRPLTVHMP